MTYDALMCYDPNEDPNSRAKNMNVDKKQTGVMWFKFRA